MTTTTLVPAHELRADEWISHEGHPRRILTVTKGAHYVRLQLWPVGEHVAEFTVNAATPFAVDREPGDIAVPRELAERLQADFRALRHLTRTERELDVLITRELGR